MKRPDYLKKIAAQLKVHPVCGLLGPRQVGKTTLAHMYAESLKATSVHFFDLEDPEDLARLAEPKLNLSKLTHALIVIDEVQLRPELFSILRVLVDNVSLNQQFLVLGSASRDLIQQSSETLAGRIGYIELMPLSIEEVGKDLSEQLWVRGGFPRSFLAKDEAESYTWRTAYIKTFLERDIPNLGFSIPAQSLRRFWLMLAHYHGQILNASELGRSLQVSDKTVKHYLDILAGTFMVRILQPWYENLGKRQVKSPKVYFRDSGILHALVGLHSEKELNTYPKLGSFWEGFAMEEIIRVLHVDTEDCYFWATQSGAELDLFILKNGKRLGFEFKYSDSPKITRSMQVALQDLTLDHLYVIYPGTKIFSLSEKITVVGLAEVTHNLLS